MAQGDKLQELLDEFRMVVGGRAKILDAVLPPLAFVILQTLLGLEAAIYGASAVAAAFTVFRLARGDPFGYALGGLAATGFAILSALLSNRAEGYFLPTIISSGLLSLLCLMSAVVKRPLVALTSHLARDWPLEWYWHGKVRPAYGEVTVAWAIFFGLRMILQWALFASGETAVLSVLSIVAGWPATIVLLVLSYLYGIWRLRTLAGPSVEEFEHGADPPWEGQQRGF